MPNDFKLGFEIKKMMKVKTFSFGNTDVFSLEFLMIHVKKSAIFSSCSLEPTSYFDITFHSGRAQYKNGIFEY